MLRANGKKIVDGADKEIILRGIGLGGWMLQEPYMLQLGDVAGTQHQIKAKIKDLIGEERTNAFYKAWLANHCRKADIDSLKAWGFNSVRLPMHFNLFTLPIEQEPVARQNTWLPEGFALVDSLLQWCTKNEIYLILDLHAAPGGQGADVAISDRDTATSSLWQSDGNRQKTMALWKKLALRYANETWIGGYDLINETNWGFEKADDKNGCAEKANVPLRQLLIDITKAIRSVDTNHLIFIEGNCWGNNYKGVLPPWDSNMAVSFHKYWNTNDQHAIQGFLDMRQQYNIPIWLGESGENSNTWFTNAIAHLEENKIGWAWWPLKKMGGSNPVEIKSNEGYRRLIGYWKGNAPKPVANEVFDSLMQLTENIKIENNVLHKDVIDAMFRQVTSTQTVPFAPHQINTDPVVFATDYDLGRNGFAYYDKDTANYRVSTGKNTQWNKGRQYRNDGVDLGTCTDSVTNGYAVGWTESGEWLQYTITVAKEGQYNIQLRTAAKESMGRVQFLVDDAVSGSEIVLPKTGDNNRWKTTIGKGVHLAKGTNRFRIRIVNGGFHLNYIRFASAGINNSNLGKKIHND